MNQIKRKVMRRLAGVIAVIASAGCAGDAPLNIDLFAKAPALGQPELVGQGIYQFHFAHLVATGGQIYAYFIDHSGGIENEVGLATSSDGKTFKYVGKVIRRDQWYDRLQASFAMVKFADGRFHMLYEGKAETGDINSVCYATSNDGVNWEKHGPVIRPDNPEAALAAPDTPTPGAALAPLDVGTPTMFRQGGVWHVYFHATDTNYRVRIGYASGSSLDKLTVSPAPLLDLESQGNETGTVGWRSSLIQMGKWYYMAYEWATDPNLNEPRIYELSRWGVSLARAASPEGPWEKSPHNPLLSNPGLGYGYDGPELAALGGKLYLYFRWTDNSTWRALVS